MCRFFGLLGGPVAPAEPWLVSTDRSLLAQSNGSAEERQSDGWGIAWYPSTRVPRVEKGIGGAYEPGERDRFLAAARVAKGPVVLGHLRKASNPMNLPKGRLIGLENSQPFIDHATLFVHNGAIQWPREARVRIGPLESKINGVNDSEVLFWLLMKHLESTGDPVGAYASTVNDLIEVWEEKGRPSGGPYTGLNVILSRGPNEIWAFCHWLGEHGSGLLDKRRPYYQMTYAADARQVVVGSEPFDSTRSDWRPLDNGQFLQAHVAEGLVGLKTGTIPLRTVPKARPKP